MSQEAKVEELSVMNMTLLAPHFLPSLLPEVSSVGDAGSSVWGFFSAFSHQRTRPHPVDSGVVSTKLLSAAGEVSCFPICSPHRGPQQSSFTSLMLCN